MNIAALLLFAACKTEKPADDSGSAIVTEDSDTATDSGTTDSGTTDTAPPCTAKITTIAPYDGATGIYHLDLLSLYFDSDGSSVAITLTDGAGTSVPFTSTWSEGNVKVTLEAEMEPDTTYTLDATLCSVESKATFTTSHLGAPLAMDPSALIGTTWEFRLSDDATITEPAFLEALAATYVTTPLLVGVTDANDQIIDLLGALGVFNNDGTYSQSTVDSIWDFPVADFTTSPYFAATAPAVTLTYKGTPIPIYQFHLEGTITDDGAYIKEGKASGYLDTQYAGAWVGTPNDPNALCTAASGFGVNCVDCGDGVNLTCLYIVAEDITATQVPGLVLDPQLGP